MAVIRLVATAAEIIVNQMLILLRSSINKSTMYTVDWAVPIFGVHASRIFFVQTSTVAHGMCVWRGVIHAYTCEAHWPLTGNP